MIPPLAAGEYRVRGGCRYFEMQLFPALHRPNAWWASGGSFDNGLSEATAAR
jgi:hypothetical protein